jgi:hypothetical protein
MEGEVHWDIPSFHFGIQVMRKVNPTTIKPSAKSYSWALKNMSSWPLVLSNPKFMTRIAMYYPSRTCAIAHCCPVMTGTIKPCSKRSQERRHCHDAVLPRRIIIWNDANSFFPIISNDGWHSQVSSGMTKGGCIYSVVFWKDRYPMN